METAAMRPSFATTCLLMAFGCSRANSDGGSAPRAPASEALSTPSTESPEATTAPSSSSKPAATHLTDTIETDAGPLQITPLHHATFYMQYAGKVLWFDPWSKADLDTTPRADYVFVSDIHHDHLDVAAVRKVSKEGTIIIAPTAVAEQLASAVVMKNGDRKELPEFTVEATPMYNIQRGPEPGKVFHEKGRGNGYLFTFSNLRVYVSGDTECTPEMAALKNIDVAFVCMNLPYTMPPAEAAGCVTQFKPKTVYPFHYRDSNLDEFQESVAAAGIDVRRRDWY